MFSSVSPFVSSLPQSSTRNMSAAVQDSATLDTLDLEELTYMMKEGEMLDDNLSAFRCEVARHAPGP